MALNPFPVHFTPQSGRPRPRGIIFIYLTTSSFSFQVYRSALQPSYCFIPSAAFFIFVFLCSFSDNFSNLPSVYKGKHGLIVLNLCSRKAQIQSFKLKDLKLKNCLDFKTDELRSGCMQAEENAESVAIFKLQACCPLYTEGII